MKEKNWSVELELLQLKLADERKLVCAVGTIAVEVS